MCKIIGLGALLFTLIIGTAAVTTAYPEAALFTPTFGTAAVMTECADGTPNY
jgi:hypothetical protein